MSFPNLIAAMRSWMIPAAPWLPWALLAAAVLFVVALTTTLVIIARRSRWPDRR